MKHAAAILALSLASASAAAQVNDFSGPSIGDWAVDTNWSLGHAPIAGENAHINDGKTVIFVSGATPALAAVRVGSDPATDGLLKVNSGSIDTGFLEIGGNSDGVLFFDGAGTIHATSTISFGNSSTGDGALLNGGGTLIGDGSMVVGNTGVGSIAQVSGAIDVQGFTAANGGTATATLDFQGGTVNVADNMFWCNAGTASVNVSGADITAGTIWHGNFTGGPATAIISAGSVTAIGDLAIGGNGGPCVITQTGGTVNASILRIGQSFELGAYDLQGGVLNLGGVQRSTGGVYDFAMSGGILSFWVFGGSTLPIDLTPTGGTISPRFAGQTQLATVNGNLSLPATTFFEIDLRDPVFEMDRLTVNGTVALGCGVSLNLLQAPDVGDEFVVIDNDGVDAIVGEFFGLPEGLEFDLFVDSEPPPHSFKITYVGGDGNDAVLVYLECPPDLNGDGILDTADISLFIAFFLAGDLAADFNGDAILDGGDIASFIDQFLTGC